MPNPLSHHDLEEIARTGGPRSPEPKPGTSFARPGQWIATHRVRPVIAEWLLRFERENDARPSAQTIRTGTSVSDGISTGPGSAGARDTLAHRCGVSQRLIYRILSGDPDTKNGSRYLSIDTVDRLFVGMDCVALFYREPTNETQSDGFADVYFHSTILDAPVPAEEEAKLADVLDAAVEKATAVREVDAEVAIESALADFDECDDDPTYSTALRADELDAIQADLDAYFAGKGLVR